MKFASIRSSAHILVFFLSFLSLPVSSLCATPAEAEKHHVDLEALAATLDAALRTAGVKSVAVADFVDTNGRGSGFTWYLSGKVSDALRKDIPNQTAQGSSVAARSPTRN